LAPARPLEPDGKTGFELGPDLIFVGLEELRDTV
jgi:hypothetical protein